jgi:thiamine-monophosphate kinase
MSGEFDLIARYFVPLTAGAPGTFGLKNDAALLPDTDGRSVVVTADCLVSGVHFRPEDPPELVAKKALRVNLSDLAAMGAKPMGYLMTLALPKGGALPKDGALPKGGALPKDGSEDWLCRFCEGLAEDQARFGISLLGGDTVSTPGPLVITITAMGTTPQGRALARGTARAGDLIFVSGSLGDGALGLRVFRGEVPELSDTAAAYLRDRYLLPQPRTALGERLLNDDLAHSAMDISDGLVADLGHIAEASGLGAEISVADLPLSSAAAAILETAPGMGAAVLGGGDDYELMFTLAPDRRAEVAQLALDLDLPLTCIGRMLEGAGVRVLAPDGSEVKVVSPGWNHMA